MTERLWVKRFLLVQGCFLLAIELGLLLALPVRLVKVIMFTAVVLNTAVTARIYGRYGKHPANRWNNLMFLAMLVNCGADVCLTLIGGPAMFAPGVLLFCAVELIYAVYLRPSRRNVLLRAGVLAAGLLLALILRMFTAGNALGVCNLTLVGGNAVTAWWKHRHASETGSGTLWAAFVLYAVGDVLVAAETMTEAGTLAHIVAADLVWVFYIPALVPLVLTYYRKAENAARAA